MKKALTVALLLGSLGFASAATTNLFIESWGTYDGGGAVLGNGNINQVGWVPVVSSQNAAPYLGIYAANPLPTDSATGETLPANTVYFSDLLDSGRQLEPGMFYTTAATDLPDGTNAAFTDIDPTQFTNLTFSVEVRGAATDTNYIAIRVGTTWYVSTNQLPPSTGLPFPVFTNASLRYTNAASAWRTLTLGTTNVTIGAAPGANLSGLITGIGIVELPTFGGFNYNRVSITATIPGDDAPPAIPPTITTPINQTTYAGGGASFLAPVSGTPPLRYFWQTNGVTLAEGSKYSGTTNNTLTISNATPDDAAVTYSLIVTNAGGAATNTGFTLTVNPVPQDFLYAETFPYVGPGGDLPVTGVGWQVAVQGASGIYSSGPGVGNVFSYSGVPATNIYYATTTGDTGGSGLPFKEINPDVLPAVTIQANFTPGNGDATNPTNVVAYWAVQMQNGSWYISANRVPVQTATVNNYQPYQLAFSRTAANWKNLTILANMAEIGAQPGGNLAGNIIGAGIVMVHMGAGGGGDFNFNTFLISTNELAIAPPVIGVNGSPFNQTVDSGGGVSFGVSATGAEPFTYGWTLNGTPLVDGGRVSGATTPTVTIASLTTADSGPVVAFVTNSVGFDQSDIYVGTTLTVENPPVGRIYSETFPFVGPIAGNYPISSAGWVEAVVNVPNALYQVIGSDGAVFAFRNTADTTAYYTSSASDTNQAGLPFPNIKLSAYSDLNIAVDIAPSFAAANVTAYIAVQMNGAWYVAANALPVPTTDSGTFATYNTPFNAAAANWKNLTIATTGAIVGSAATANLTGVMTGVGLVFVTTGTGGTHNFDNIVITGTGVGGINLGAFSNGAMNLTWVGNPSVNLQSTTNLISPNWQDVPNSSGKYSMPIPTTGPQTFFRLEGP